MTVQRENFDVAATEVVQEAESVLEGTPVVEPVPVEPVPVEPAPPAEVPRPDKKEDPEVTPMCCGGTPGFLVGPHKLLSEGGVADSGGDVEHAHDCPNHPNNIAV
ncbi:hypothetical protein V1227_34845 [Lentzea sp. DG1S-22]|uniref:hypothetical protein n=1 Tax=Lentzea sp. DG1S-22 TaxID=3108822 RepID=UPI002E76BABC|nr:hypothetical protein [Lentzea sp. DG1S-22]WVH80142.1 hypothetical protein V1227_34845 [Lentzea sp. DG1S-22]